MGKNQNSEAFYKKLKAQLSDTSLWPTTYLFKFIVPTDPKRIEQIEQIFDHSGAVINKKPSRNGKYTSVSINVNMKNPDEVVSKYKAVSVVEDIISL